MQFDSQFIEQLLKRDELAFAQFYEQTTDVFFAYLMSHYKLSEQEALDITAEVYLKIWNNLDKYDQKYEFGQFVRTILKNYCKDYVKASKPLLFSDLEVTYDDDHVESVIDTMVHEDDVADLFDTQYTYEMIDSVISQLDTESQELIHMRFVLQYTYDEIAQAL